MFRLAYLEGSEKRKSIKDFAFPSGLRVRVVNPTESMSEAQRLG